MLSCFHSGKVGLGSLRDTCPFTGFGAFFTDWTLHSDYACSLVDFRLNPSLSSGGNSKMGGRLPLLPAFPHPGMM